MAEGEGMMMDQQSQLPSSSSPELPLPLPDTQHLDSSPASPPPPPPQPQESSTQQTDASSVGPATTTTAALDPTSMDIDPAPAAASPVPSPPPATIFSSEEDDIIVVEQLQQQQQDRDHDQKLPPPPLLHDNAADSSASGSAKDDSVQPYGTRSRNRSGPRPNYTDEPDYNFDAPPSKSDAAVKRSLPTDTSLASSHVDAPRSFASANASKRQATNGAVAASSDSLILPTSEATAEPRKKRKYQWKNGSRPSPNAKSSHLNSIPGTSHFLANKHSETPDPPTKRRRTEDAAGHSAVGVTGKRTASSSASTLKLTARDTCVYSFEKSGALLKDGKLRADDGTTFAVNDHVYLICEPPGEPYYLCRIMEFRKDDMNNLDAPITSMLVNWYYRPKDIGRYNIDPRFLFASMQSDESPITSLRGKCSILHRTEISDIEEYRRQRDTFWFSQLYDRYIHRPYELLPAKAVINVPANVKKAILDRWQFLAVESTRQRELTSAVKLCRRCKGYCAPNDSVDCGVCRNTYHMACVSPPLFKKPSRGFAWACGPCSRAQERRLEARHTAVLPDAAEAEEEFHEEEEEAGAMIVDPAATATELATNDHTQAEVAKAQLWPWRYLGIHCNIEDVLQYDDRAIYPRASSRLGAKHQAAITAWFGQPVQLVKPLDIKKRSNKSGASAKTAPKHSKETLALIEADKVERATRSKWIQDEPAGYVARGEDYDSADPRCTAERLFVVPPDARPKFAAANVRETSNERICDEYFSQVKTLGRQSNFTRHIFPSSRGSTNTEPQIVMPTNYIDKALNTLFKNHFSIAPAMEEMRKIKTFKDFGDPILSQEELKKFEEGVGKFGSELRLVKKHVKTRPYGDIVRFYYIWKKTERGQQVWGRHDARRGSRKRAEVSWTEIADDEDDSAFDGNKAIAKKRRFQCKFCSERYSRQWRRAPNVAPGAVALADPKVSAKDKNNQLVVALCQRCANPWRRYSIKWEDPDELAKSISTTTGRAWKKVQEEQLLRELVLANEQALIPTTGLAAKVATENLGIELTVPIPDPAAKKREREMAPTPLPVDQQPKKKIAVPPPPRPPTPPIVPAEPKLRTFPCQICFGGENIDTLVVCNSCKLTVHRRCFALSDNVNPNKWVCDTCSNDKTGLVSFNYNCVLCTAADRQHDMVEPPKISHKKKNDRDRERERQEKHLADKLAAEYRRDQAAKGRPIYPRDAVKHTTSNNWAHVTCAIWIPEIKFADASHMDNIEGMATAMTNAARMESPCQLCKMVGGAVVACNYEKCNATFHVGCAHEFGYRFGFDIKPIKSTQKSSTPTLTLGAESGLVTAVIYCKEHEAANTSILHDMHETHAESGRTAMRAFVETYKQADLTYTGTARKANMLIQSTKGIQIAQPTAAAAAAAGRRPSLINSVAASSKARRFSMTSTSDGATGYANGVSDDIEGRECITCGTDVSFRWWHPATSVSKSRMVVDGPNGTESHGKDVQCHKCHVAVAEGRMPPTPPKSDDDEDIEMQSKPDFFQLTMDPAPPAPLAQQFSEEPLVPNWPGNYPPEHAPREPYVNNQENPADIEAWTRALWACTIVLKVLPTNKQICFRGEEFGSLNDPPMVAWNHVLQKLRAEGLIEYRDHIITSQESERIDNCNSLMVALASIIKCNANEVHWTLTVPPPPKPNRSFTKSTLLSEDVPMDGVNSTANQTPLQQNPGSQFGIAAAETPQQSTPGQYQGPYPHQGPVQHATPGHVPAVTPGPQPGIMAPPPGHMLLQAQSPQIQQHPVQMTQQGSTQQGSMQQRSPVSHQSSVIPLQSGQIPGFSSPHQTQGQHSHHGSPHQSQHLLGAPHHYGAPGLPRAPEFQAQAAPAHEYQAQAALRTDSAMQTPLVRAENGYYSQSARHETRMDNIAPELRGDALPAASTTTSAVFPIYPPSQVYGPPAPHVRGVQIDGSASPQIKDDASSRSRTPNGQVVTPLHTPGLGNSQLPPTQAGVRFPGASTSPNVRNLMH